MEGTRSLTRPKHSVSTLLLSELVPVATNGTSTHSSVRTDFYDDQDHDRTGVVVRVRSERKRTRKKR